MTKFKELECGICGRVSDHYMMVYSKLYTDGKLLTDNGQGDSHNYWCLRCVVIEAMKPYGSVTNFLVAEVDDGK